LYTAIHIHGNRPEDRGYYRDGIPLVSFFGGGDAPHAYGATGAQEEVNFQTTGIPASVSVGGMAINMVMKQGGNNLSGSLFTSFMNESLQSSNLDDELRDRGVEATSGMEKAYDIDGTIGGPIMRDKLWFFGTVRIWSVTTLLANQFFEDGTQQDDFVRKGEQNVKLTWQVNPANKLSVTYIHENSLRPTRRSGATFVSEEASSVNKTEPGNYFIYGNYTGTIGDSWIVEGRASTMKYDYTEFIQPYLGPDDVARLDIVASRLTGAPTRLRIGSPRTANYQAALTRLGDWNGSHEFQIGAQGNHGTYITERFNQKDIILRFRSGTPDSVDLVNTPLKADNRVQNVGLYAQDRWRIGERITLNLGVRYEYKNLSIAEQSSPAGTWVPARSNPEIPVQKWHNVVPRLGVAYDLTGQGRTVLKGSYSRYMGNDATGLAEEVNPLFYSTNRCAWTDFDGDLFAQPPEISRCQGFEGGITTTVDPNLRRPFSNEYSVGVQHELAPNLAVSVTYNRKENRNERAPKNLAVPRESYIPIVINNPLTNEPLTIFNQDPATLGLQENVITNDSRLDNTYNGIEFAVQRRFSGNAYIQAGYHYGKDLGRIAAGELNDPNDDIFIEGAMRTDEPHQFKFSGNILLPGDISLSGFLIARSGHSRQRTLVVSRNLVPELTRTSESIRLERNDDNRYDGVTMLDLRVGRAFPMGQWRLEPFLDLYNLFNANTVLNEVTTLGPNLGQVSSTINPRVVRIGFKMNF
ncbi:MAG: TonB-dependent receptor plug domain-containing protein, partial [Vicinamibacteria bacterium]